MPIRHRKASGLAAPMDTNHSTKIRITQAVSRLQTVLGKMQDARSNKIGLAMVVTVSHN